MNLTLELIGAPTDVCQASRPEAELELNELRPQKGRRYLTE